LQELSAYARQACEQMQGEGRRVRFVRSVFVPEDETCFCLYEATSAADAREAARRAALPCSGVAKAITAHQQERSTT
jgi:hypothetical protein